MENLEFSRVNTDRKIDILPTYARLRVYVFTENGRAKDASLVCSSFEPRFPKKAVPNEAEKAEKGESYS